MSRAAWGRRVSARDELGHVNDPENLGPRGAGRGVPHTVRGRHGSCSCASQTSSGSSARTRSWPSVCGSSSSPNKPPRRRRRRPDARPSRRRPPASRACGPAPGRVGARAAARARRRPARTARRAPRPTRESCSRPRCARRRAPGAGLDRPAGEEVVAAAVVEVQVRVDDDVDAGEVEGLLAQWRRWGSRSATAGCSSVMPVSTSTRASGWSMTCT